MDKKDVHIVQSLLKRQMLDVLAVTVFLEQNQENVMFINSK